MKDKYTLVRQPYVVTMSKNRLNVHEMRIMLRIVEALQNDMIYGKQRLAVQQTIWGDKVIQVPTKSLVPEGKNHAYVKAALRSIRTKNILIRGRDEKGEYEVNAGLITESKYYLNNEIVELQISRHLLPSYLALANNYSQYSLEVAFNSSSSYVMKLYQFVSHWKDKSKLTVSIDDLRDLLQIGDKYQHQKDLKRRVLLPASRELKKRGDVWFELGEPIKKGRKITGYVFNIYKRTYSEQNSEVSAILLENIKQTLQLLFKFRAHHLKQLAPLLNKPSLYPNLRNKILDISTQIRKDERKIRSRAAYALTSLRNEFKAHFSE